MRIMDDAGYEIMMFTTSVITAIAYVIVVNSIVIADCYYDERLIITADVIVIIVIADEIADGYC